MNEKRRHPRYQCRLKVKYTYFNNISDETSNKKPEEYHGKGWILDISRGGLFIITDKEINVNRPVIVKFNTNSTSFEKKGIIVRVGLFKNNPSDELKNYKNHVEKEKYYFAVEFEESIDSLSGNDLQ